MDTLTAGYQFSADSFRRFIIRTLTDDIPPDGDEKEIARFILRHPAFNGGWLLFLAAEIHERSHTHKSITVTVSVDNYLSWMDIAVSGLPELPDMPFCDFSFAASSLSIRVCPRQNQEKNDENSPHIPGDAYNTHPRTPGRKN